MGDWYLRPDPMNPGQQVWSYDKSAPSPDPTVTGMLPAIDQPVKLPQVTPRVELRDDESMRFHSAAQDDLSEYDDDPALEIVPTEKLGPLDEVLIQPPQDPEWRPEGQS